MPTHAPPKGAGQLRSVLELSLETRRSTDTVRRHIRRGKVQTSRVGGAHVLDQAQWAAALAYFAQLDQLEEEERADG